MAIAPLPLQTVSGCLGRPCQIVKVETRKPKIDEATWTDACSPAQVGRLQDRAQAMIEAAAMATGRPCPEGCVCQPLGGPAEPPTEWFTMTTKAFDVVDAKNPKCVLKVAKGSVEARMSATRGLCRPMVLPVLSLLFSDRGDLTFQNPGEIDADIADRFRKLVETDGGAG